MNEAQRWRCDKHPERELSERFVRETPICYACVGLSFMAAVLQPHSTVTANKVNNALDFVSENKERWA